jgi:predicted DsbA family dithiol-disulfide isomerase
LKENFGINIRWTAFPLHPETPEEGLALEALFAGRPVDVPSMLARMKAVAAAEGLPFGDRKMTFNSRRAQELAKWAETQGQGEAFHDTVFRAYFVNGKNIAHIGILIELAEGLGLSGSEAEQVLESRTFKEAVDQDWLRSRQLGVTAVPTFHYQGQSVVGAQPYELLARLFRSE